MEIILISAWLLPVQSSAVLVGGGMEVVVGQISQIYDAPSTKLCFVIYNIAGPLWR